MTTTFMAKEADRDARKWWTVDLAQTDLTLGRLATKLAKVLTGKHKASYTPNIDVGDFVIVLNADKVKVTGSKADTKEYPYFTGYPSGLRSRKFSDLVQRDPGRILRYAVERMMPRNKLRRHQILKLKCVKGTTHRHKAQNPQPLDLTKI